jgi:putative ABC transport system permease protein
MALDRLWTIVRLRVRSLLKGTALDAELDEELRYHVDRQTDELVSQGVSPGEARTMALRAIGGIERRKDEMRDQRGVSLVEDVGRDLRFGLRQLRRQPGFAVTAIVSLALGIGANTAIFQLLSALSLRTLPVRAPSELTEVRLTGDGRDGRQSGRNRQVSLPQYREILARQQAFSSMLAFGDTRFNLSPHGEIRTVDGLWVSGSFFETLGVRPLVGRLIGPDDDRPGCGEGVAVISYALWQRDFGGRADVVGQLLPGDSPAPIIGVTPQEFFGVEVGRQFGVARPICASGFGANDHWWLAAIGRLKPGWTRAQATAQLSQVLPDIQRTTMPNYRPELAHNYMTMGVEAVDASAGVSPLRASYQRPLGILMIISGLVLVMASVNLANLLLARAAARRHEFALCLALGGTRRRLVQQALTESALVAVLGAAVAVGVAIVFSQSIPPLMSTRSDRIYLDLELDWRIFAFTAAVAVATSLVVGIAPALRAGKASAIGAPARGSAGNDGLRLRRGLVALQLAITLMLLFAGLLFLRTFRNLSLEEKGLGERGVLIASVFFSEERLPPERRLATYADLDERVRTLEGVVSSAAAFTTPLGGSYWESDFVSDTNVREMSYGNRVSPGYFATLGTPLVAGRDFSDADGPGAPAVAIVNESLAKGFWSGSPLGHRFTQPSDSGGPGVQFEVVGVVRDQPYEDLRQPHPHILFIPLAQEPDQKEYRRYVIRSSRSPAQMMAAMTAAVDEFDPTAGIRYALLDTQVGDGMLQERLMARLSAVFGAVALLLAVVGLYGIVSYTVASRRAEIGVRVALGASGARIVRTILGDIGRTMAAGLVAGGLLALAAGRGLASLVYGVSSTDVMTLSAAAAVLAGAGLLAAMWPARRAAAIDPVAALRET